ncbi:PREDICTED: uncharacterized protein LOC109584649 [Amphimedon queenslandica]|uniref:Uncharacterized protein n=1 Tax=Amphimedon queenslandica TaxID=400682 RepID=A0A1X7U5Q8_AMPQE|nr:PREDICTED: uncharacterized protein LOC109584649 [Amphimedon queenslandica]|eukprot:XP_019856027.1 PREDICTED: uncharacterized protein LOC109584649 [Amphimedon queenslandica]
MADKDKVEKKIEGIARAVTKEKSEHVLILVISGLLKGKALMNFQQKVEDIFRKLFKFAIVPIIDEKKDFIVAALKEATERKYYDSLFNNFTVFFLFLTPVYVEGDRKYIVCKDGRISIKDDIISPFNTNFSHKNKVFLFDGCLDESQSPPRDLVTSVEVESLGVTDTKWLPKNGNNLIAFSPFTVVPKGKPDSIGKWSLTFMDNLEKYVLPITLILDKTWDDLAPPISGPQEPHYVSSMEPILLHKYDLIDFENRNSGPPGNVPPEEIEVPKDITLIYDCRPDQKDLIKALEKLGKAEKSVWRDKFGARFKAIDPDLNVSFATKFEYLIENMYSCGLPKSWRQVLEVLDQHLQIKVDEVKDGKKEKVPVSYFVKAYMTDNYDTYIGRKK